MYGYEGNLTSTDEDMILDDNSARRYDFEDPATVGLSVFSPGKDAFDDDNKLMGLPNDDVVGDEDSEDEWQDPASDDFEDDDL
jgi:DNA-directed RNA polymerase subunit beta'